jgi:hypothetical protein
MMATGRQIMGRDRMCANETCEKVAYGTSRWCKEHEPQKSVEAVQGQKHPRAQQAQFVVVAELAKALAATAEGKQASDDFMVLKKAVLDFITDMDETAGVLGDGDFRQLLHEAQTRRGKVAASKPI